MPISRPTARFLLLAAAYFFIAIARARAQAIDLSTEWKFAADAENRGRELGYATAAFDDSKWATLDARAPWESQGFDGLDGYAWYRKKISLASDPTSDGMLELGTVDDIDEVFVNGERIGGTGEFPPVTKSAWNKNRVYTIPKRLLHSGENIFAIRVFDEMDDGGMHGGIHRFTLGPETAELLKLKLTRPTGFAAANCAFAMELSTNGEFPARIFTNPPVPGLWFEQSAVGRLSFREGDVEISAPEMNMNDATRMWPFGSARYANDAISNIIFDLEVFSPLARVSRPYWNAAPVGFARFRIQNISDRPRTVEIIFRLALEGETQAVVADEHDGVIYSGIDSERFSIRCNEKAAFVDGNSIKRYGVRIKIPPKDTKELRYCFAQSPRTARGSLDSGAWPNSSDLAILALKSFDDAYHQTLAIDRYMPKTGDDAIDRAFRAYCSNAVQLTKIVSDGTVSVMGYAEMTQRDGYWGSFLHNILFPDLEQKMIEEIFTEQRADGKVPTAILPNADRQDDIDTNCYVMLRAFRFAKWNHSLQFLSKIAANLKGAAFWLGTRDDDGDGLPDARSRFGDWKDARGFADRKYSPHAAFLYIAALDQLLEVMNFKKDNLTIGAEIEKRLALARKTVHSQAADGGLWNGKYYIERWRRRGESRPADPLILQNEAILNEDQIVGILFGQIAPERANLIFDALAANRANFGIRESYPYRPANIGFRPGDYMNGGIWPWLNYADAWARIAAGRTSEGIELLKTVSKYDIYQSAGSLSNECLDGETGEGLRNAPQLWNSNFIAAVYHGLFGVERELNGMLHISPRAILGRGWHVRVPVPEGNLELRDGDGAEPEILHWSLASELPICIKLPNKPEWRAVLQPGDGKQTFPAK